MESLASNSAGGRSDRSRERRWFDRDVRVLGLEVLHDIGPELLGQVRRDVRLQDDLDLPTGRFGVVRFVGWLVCRFVVASSSSAGAGSSAVSPPQAVRIKTMAPMLASSCSPRCPRLVPSIHGLLIVQVVSPSINTMESSRGSITGCRERGSPPKQASLRSRSVQPDQIVQSLNGGIIHRQEMQSPAASPGAGRVF